MKRYHDVMCRAADPFTIWKRLFQQTNSGISSNIGWENCRVSTQLTQPKKLQTPNRFQSNFVFRAHLSMAVPTFIPPFSTLNPTSICQMHVTRNICWRLFYKLSTDCSFHGTRRWVKWVFCALNWNWNIELRSWSFENEFFSRLLQYFRTLWFELLA